MLIHPWDAAGPDEDGVPTSYYAAVQFTCDAAIVDDPEGKAELLRTQPRHLQPAGDHAEVSPDVTPYGWMLPGLRAMRLRSLDVVAKFKYDDHNPTNTGCGSPSAWSNEVVSTTRVPPPSSRAGSTSAARGNPLSRRTGSSTVALATPARSPSP